MHWIFDSQAQSNEIIQDICASLRVPRHSLGVYATPKGYVAGHVRFTDTQSGKSELASERPILFTWRLLEATTQIEITKKTVKYIVIIEKNAAFRQVFV